MFTFYALINLFAPVCPFCCHISAFDAFFFSRFVFGDEFTLRIVRTSEKFTPFRISFQYVSAALGTFYGEFFGIVQRFCIFAFGICAAGEEFASGSLFYDHRSTAFVANLVGGLLVFALFFILALYLFCIFAFGIGAAGDKFPEPATSFYKFGSAQRTVSAQWNCNFLAFYLFFPSSICLIKGS